MTASILPSSHLFRRLWRSILPLANEPGGMTYRPQRAVKPGNKGAVYLVGAGPGDAELLTLKALRLLQQVDLVLYDDLVSADVLALIPRHVARAYVGKRCNQHSMSQLQICNLLVEKALQGNNIVRLKGGDPAIFARSTEECQALTNAGIDFAIVPGITAASGLSAFCGIALTQRDCAQSVRFITARMQQAETEPDWQALATASEQETLVFYMGLNRLELITQRLMAAGVAAKMPVALVENISCENQQALYGQIDNIATKARQSKFTGPALVVVGKVVAHRQRVNPDLLQIHALKEFTIEVQRN
jgi:uroporphyrin-III C-methyltransferase